MPVTSEADWLWKWQTRSTWSSFILQPIPPNLNLIERVWRLVKARCLWNKYLPNFMLFTGALDEFLVSLNGKNREHLKKLVIKNYQVLQNPKIKRREV